MYIPRIFKAFHSMEKKKKKDRKRASSKPQSPIFHQLTLKMVTNHILLIHSPKATLQSLTAKGKKVEHEHFHIHHPLGLPVSHGSPWEALSVQQNSSYKFCTFQNVSSPFFSPLKILQLLAILPFRTNIFTSLNRIQGSSKLLFVNVVQDKKNILQKLFTPTFITYCQLPIKVLQVSVVDFYFLV